MTVQFIITEINTTPKSAGADSIGMDIKSLKIKSKSKKQKPDIPKKSKQLPSSQADATKYPCHLAGLSLVLSPRKILYL
jgi:hypothetical protein